MRCPSCGTSGLKHRHDRMTKQPVREGRRFLMHCSSCGDTPVIGRREMRKLKERPPLFWWIPAVAGALSAGADLGIRLLAHTLHDNTSAAASLSPLMIGAFMTGGAAAVLALALESLYLAVHAESVPERLDSALVSLVYLAAAVLMIVMLFYLRTELRHSGAVGPPLNSAQPVPG